MAKAHADSWAVTDEFWKRVEPLVPQPMRDVNKLYARRPGAGRPAKPARLVFEAIVYDESGDIARWSPGWIERRSDPPLEDRWMTESSTYPSCKRRTESFAEHFYYVSEEC